jgi:hypothetical protein
MSDSLSPQTLVDLMRKFVALRVGRKNRGYCTEAQIFGQQEVLTVLITYLLYSADEMRHAMCTKSECHV